MTVPRFSIVVPTFNRPDLLREALASVVLQTTEDFECIVVDDGSTTAQAAIPDDPRFRCIDHEVNRGNYAARNTGAEAASGQVLCFLDDDDVFTPDRLELAEIGLKEADLALCWFARLGAPVITPSGRTLNGIVHSEILDSTVPSVGAVAVRREVFEPFDETYVASGDLEWWLRQATTPVRTVERVGYLVRRHDGVRTTNSVARRIEASHRLLREHADYFARHRRAKAYRLYRLAIMYRTIGDRRGALSHLVRSFASSPSVRVARPLLTLSRPAPRVERSAR